MEHPEPAQLTCIAVGAYRGALSYGAAYAVLAISTADGRSQVKLHDDRGRLRWYPLSCFAPAGSPAPQLVAVQLIDSLDAVQTSAIEVELQLSTGDRRWCAFAIPEALGHFGDTLPGTAVRIHAAPNLIILSELSEERIRQVLQLLLEDGRLLDHTLPLDETPLAGGNLTPVVRVGESVRRAQGPWSPAVHALLRHLEQVGFSGAPRFRGVDAQRREILSYLPGSVGFTPAMWREDSLVAAARLLRAYHDATRSFVPPADAQAGAMKRVGSSEPQASAGGAALERLGMGLHGEQARTARCRC